MGLALGGTTPRKDQRVLLVASIQDSKAYGVRLGLGLARH